MHCAAYGKWYYHIIIRTKWKWRYGANASSYINIKPNSSSATTSLLIISPQLWCTGKLNECYARTVAYCIVFNCSNVEFWCIVHVLSYQISTSNPIMILRVDFWSNMKWIVSLCPSAIIIFEIGLLILILPLRFRVNSQNHHRRIIQWNWAFLSSLGSDYSMKFNLKYEIYLFIRWRMGFTHNESVIISCQ